MWAEYVAYSSDEMQRIQYYSPPGSIQGSKPYGLLELEKIRLYEILRDKFASEEEFVAHFADGMPDGPAVMRAWRMRAFI